VAFTYHGRTIGMKQDGTLVLRNSAREPVDIDGNVLDPGEALPERGIADLHSFVRADNFGSIFRVVESNPDNPAESDTFTFYPVFFGSQGDSAFDTARPDNLSIDADGVSFDSATIEITRIEGVGDFVVLASAIDNASGTFGFGAVNPAGGLVEGKVVRITFRALKPTTSPVVIDEAKVVAGDVANARLTGFELAAGVAGGFESRFPTALRPGATTHP